MQTLENLEHFNTLLESGSEFLIFKHSSSCNISGGACREVSIAIDELKLDNIYLLDVLNTGNLKYEVADIIKVKHESPQLLIFSGGKLTAHASHSTISKGWIINQLKGRHDTRKF